MRSPAPTLAFVRCPPGFRQLRPAALPLGLKPRRQPALAPFPLVPPRPPVRPERFRLGLHLRRAWQAATGLPPALREPARPWG